MLLTGASLRRTNYVIIALWVSLIALLLQYQAAGGEILGSYFGYLNTTVYTFTLITLVASFVYLFFKTPSMHGKFSRYAGGLVAACLITGGSLLMINLWINAHFIEDKLPGTAIMQVVTFTPPSYCSYQYVFYKVGSNGKISYLCPNYYGLLPAVGHLDVAPDFLARQLMRPIKANNKN